MAKAEASVQELVGMIERGELRLPEMQRRYVWKSTRVRDLLDSLYRGYPSGAILLWETDEAVPLQEFSVSQKSNPYQNTRLLLDGQQRLTSLSAVIRGEPVFVRGRMKPLDLLFNLEHPDQLVFVTEVNEEANDDDGSQNSLLVALSDDASTLHRAPVDLPNPPFELERRYVRSTLRDIDMGFSGRYAPNNLVHQAIRSLTAGSPILLRETEGRSELTDANGIVVGRMSRSFTIPRGTQFIFGRVAAIIVRKREDSAVEFQNQSRCDAWEIVVPELVFAPNT